MGTPCATIWHRIHMICIQVSHTHTLTHRKGHQLKPNNQNKPKRQMQRIRSDWECEVRRRTLHAAKLLIGISEIFERLPENCLVLPVAVGRWCERATDLQAAARISSSVFPQFNFHEQGAVLREWARDWVSAKDHANTLASCWKHLSVGCSI